MSARGRWANSLHSTDALSRGTSSAGRGNSYRGGPSASQRSSKKECSNYSKDNHTPSHTSPRNSECCESFRESRAYEDPFSDSPDYPLVTKLSNSRKKGPAEVLQGIGPIEVFANIFSQKVDLKQVERYDVVIVATNQSGGGGGRGGRGYRGGGRGGRGGRGVGRAGYSQSNLSDLEPVKIKDRRPALEAAMAQYKNWCYDDDKILISNQKFGSFRNTVTVGRAAFDVTVSWLETVVLGLSTPEQQKTSDQILNIIWKEAHLRNSEERGRRIFFPLTCEKYLEFDSRAAWGVKGKILRLGVYQVSQFILKRSKDGEHFESVICVNPQGALGYRPEPLSDLIERLCGVPCDKLCSMGRDLRAIEDSLKSLKDLKIDILQLRDSKTGKVGKRTKKVASINLRMTASNHKFYDANRRREVSIAEYFDSEHKIRLRHQNWPLVCTNWQKKTFFPLELCVVKTQFVAAAPTSESVKAAICDKMTMDPKARRLLIQHFVTNNYKNNEILQSYGISSDTKMKSVQAEVLPPPQIQYGTDNPLSVTNGAWNLKSQKFFDAKALRSWVVVAIDCRQLESTIQKFLLELKKNADTRGMELSRPQKILFSRASYSDLEEVKKIIKENLRGCQLVLFIVPEAEMIDTNQDVGVRTIVKTVFDDWIPTSHLKIQKTPVLNGSFQGIDQHLSNVLAKINEKLGGHCHAITRPQNLTFLNQILSQKCAIIGADVCHLGTSMRKYIPSLVGMCGSVDGKFAKWSTSMLAQAGDKLRDVIQSTERMLGDIFNSIPPQEWPRNLIYVRDGISEGEFDKVLEIEVPGFEKAYIREGLVPPKMTVIVCTKRIKLRLFVKETETERMNVPPGLVIVDDLLSSDRRYPNFYLVSHAGIKGTSNPCRYFILKDEIGKSINPHHDVPKMFWPYVLYDMCHLYQRCQRSVSYPAPAYYAHLLADRARLYADRFTRREMGMSSIVAVGPEKRGPPDPKQVEELAKMMNPVFRNICLQEGFKQFFV